MSFQETLRRFGWCVAAAALGTATSLPASASLVTSRAVLAGNDFIEWGQLGVEFDQVLEPGVITTNSGGIASVDNPNGDLYSVDQGSGFGGNFASGAPVLSTLFTPGRISIVFAEGLSKVGAQIQVNDFGTFTGVISVFSATVLLETYNVAGNSNGLGNNSAIFLGVARSTADIRRVDFDVSGPVGAADPDFAINRVDLTVPEPATTMQVMVGLSLLTGLVRSSGRTRR